MIPCAFPLGIWTSVNPLKTFPDSSLSHQCLRPAPTCPASKEGGALRDEPEDWLATFGVSIRFLHFIILKKAEMCSNNAKKSKDDLTVREIYFPIFRK